MSLSRRLFLKSSVGGAAGITLTGANLKSAMAKPQQSGFAWTDKMAINPDIDNMRVVSMHDPEMAGDPLGSSINQVQKVVNDEKVRKNMDRMAMELAGKDTADEAWRTIFRSSKAWEDTKVIIKLNCVENKMLARVSIIKKIVDVLIDFGVKPENIVLFDGQGADWQSYEPYVSLTDDTLIRAKLSNSYSDVGGKVEVQIPDIDKGYAPGDMVNGATDIVVNIAVNKGHNSPTFNIGMTTLCLKNHFGTFLSDGGFGGMYGGGLMAMHLHSTTGLININKIKEIVGGDPVRQQLCIIDSMWAMKGGPTGSVDGKYDLLVMGTFAGAVDYCCVKKIREEVMGVTNHQAAVIPRYLTEFGYSESDPVWVAMTPTGTTTGKVNRAVSSRDFHFTFDNRGVRRNELHFSLPNANRSKINVAVFDMHGSLVRKFSVSGNSLSVRWDGKTNNGGSVRPGTYVVKVAAGRYSDSERLTILR